MHRDYGNLYCTWLLVLLPLKYAHAAGLGVSVHYIASSGFAKLFVAGPKQWCHPLTLRGVLQTYAKVSSMPLYVC